MEALCNIVRGKRNGGIVSMFRDVKERYSIYWIFYGTTKEDFWLESFVVHVINVSHVFKLSNSTCSMVVSVVLDRNHQQFESKPTNWCRSRWVYIMWNENAPFQRFWSNTFCNLKMSTAITASTVSEQIISVYCFVLMRHVIRATTTSISWNQF